MITEAPKAKLSTNGKKENVVQSVKRAAEILNCISDDVSSVTDIAQKCKLNKSTVHRLLRALIESELVMRDPINRQYFLGSSIIKLIYSAMPNQQYLTRCASDEMIRLSEITGESVSLGIKMGTKIVYIHAVDSTSPLKVVGDRSKVRSMHLGVDGSVLLSQVDDNQVLNILKNIQLELKAKGENINTEELITRIRVIRQQGYAIGYSEFTPGVTCISVPLRNYIVPAALDVVGPEVRMKPNIKKLVRDAYEYGARISNRFKEWNSLGLNKQ